MQLERADKTKEQKKKKKKKPNKWEPHMERGRGQDLDRTLPVHGPRSSHRAENANAFTKQTPSSFDLLRKLLSFLLFCFDFFILPFPRLFSFSGPPPI